MLSFWEVFLHICISQTSQIMEVYDNLWNGSRLFSLHVWEAVFASLTGGRVYKWLGPIITNLSGEITDRSMIEQQICISQICLSHTQTRGPIEYTLFCSIMLQWRMGPSHHQTSFLFNQLISTSMSMGERYQCRKLKRSHWLRPHS